MAKYRTYKRPIRRVVTPKKYKATTSSGNANRKYTSQQTTAPVQDERQEAVRAYKRNIKYALPMNEQALAIGRAGTDERAQAIRGYQQNMYEAFELANKNSNRPFYTMGRWGGGNQVNNPYRPSYNPTPEQRYWRNIYNSYIVNPANEYRIPNPAITPEYYGYWVNPETNLVERMTANQMNANAYPYGASPNVYNPTYGMPAEASAIQSSGRKFYSGNKGTAEGGFDVPNPETEGVLPEAPITEYPEYPWGGGGGGGGGGSSYYSPYTTYQKGYTARANEPNTRPAFRTPGTAASNYYNNPQTTYRANWQQLLTSWRI